MNHSYIKKKFIFLSYSVFLLASNFLMCFSLEAQTTDLPSHVELSINRYIMDHRFGLHALTINIEMYGMPIVSGDKIINQIKDFLADYPNQEDYWEIVNKKLIIFLSEIYPGQEQIQTTLSIEPDFAKPFSRKSICKLNNGEIEQQTFSFSMLNHPFRNHLACITAEIGYEPYASLNDYVNFFSVRDAIEVFIKENTFSNLPDNFFPEKIANHLLARFNSVKGFTVIIEIPAHACNPARCCWNATISRDESSISPTEKPF